MRSRKTASRFCRRGLRAGSFVCPWRGFRDFRGFRNFRGFRTLRARPCVRPWRRRRFLIDRRGPRAGLVCPWCGCRRFYGSRAGFPSPWQTPPWQARPWRGFTIIEVMIVLGITGLIFAGATIGVHSGITRQRYNDTINDTVRLLRNQYDAVSRISVAERDATDASAQICQAIFSSSTSSTATGFRGRSDCNVYGVAVFLGARNGALLQSYDLVGIDYPTFRECLKDSAKSSVKCKDFQNAFGTGSAWSDWLTKYGLENSSSDTSDYHIEESLMNMNDAELLGVLKTSNYFKTGSGTSAKSLLTTKLLSIELPWDGRLETPEGEAAKGIILIFRSPRDGTVHTFYKKFDNTIGDILDYSTAFSGPALTVDPTAALNTQGVEAIFDSTDGFTTQDIYLCVNSEDASIYGKVPNTNRNVRRTIRIVRDGHNSSAVELINLDDSDNASKIDKCNQVGPAGP